MIELAMEISEIVINIIKAVLAGEYTPAQGRHLIDILTDLEPFEKG